MLFPFQMGKMAYKWLLLTTLQARVCLGIFWGMVFFNPIHHLLFGGEKAKNLGPISWIQASISPQNLLVSCNLFYQFKCFLSGEPLPLKKNNIYKFTVHLKINGWKMFVFLGGGMAYFQGRTVSFKESTP